MKKKIICGFLAASLLALPACGKSTTNNDVVSATSESVVEEVNQTNTLVVYFSRVDNSALSENVDANSGASLNVVDGENNVIGDTRVLAEIAVEETGGDVLSILTDIQYPEDEAATYNQVRQEQVDGTIPELVSEVGDFSQYKNIILIYPNWLGTVPAAVTAFLDENDLSRKKLLPICSYEATGLDATVETIESHTKAKVLEPLEIRGRSATTSGTRTAVKKFIYDSDLKYDK